LSAMKKTMGSEPRSVNSISAAPGPIPRMFPLKASDRMSWPAAYIFISLASLAASWKADQARECTSLWFSPL